MWVEQQDATAFLGNGKFSAKTVSKYFFTSVFDLDVNIQQFCFKLTLKLITKHFSLLFVIKASINLNFLIFAAGELIFCLVCSKAELKED